HLLPTLAVPNSHRGHMPFSMVPDGQEKDVEYATESGSKQTDSYFEPSDVSKGNVARAMFYFAITYVGNSVHSGAFNSGNFWDSKVEMLLEWNRMDPPDAAEKHRNDVIASYQGNRNPFIDDPSLADKIGAAVWKAMQ
ncbi:MAG TPA: endonuclease, partial [Elusimicrobiales bacterium]|nr:endonuclease [Elusimicrobiales bacterium]